MPPPGEKWTSHRRYTETAMTMRIDLSNGSTFELLSTESANSWKALHGNEMLNGKGMFI